MIESRHDCFRNHGGFVRLLCMELIEITETNIDSVMQDCLSLQKQLIKLGEAPNEDLLRRTATDEQTYMLGLVEAGHLRGLGVVGYLTHPVHITAYINNIVVDESYRGRGYFTTIMEALEKKARQWGADEIALTCSRPTVQPLYIKRGYEERDTKYYRKMI